jgi:branched-chain amino acid transport system permease protein
MDKAPTATSTVETSNGQPVKPADSRARVVVAGAIIATLALVPVAATLLGQPFYVTLVSRIMIFALAAVGLNLVLGYGAMVSFGHALYIGIGAYAVGILSFFGVTSGWVHLVAALGAGVVSASLIGLVCLRSSGVGFIMITLAFAQMFYFLAVSLKAFGGDDGLPLNGRSDFGFLDLNNNVVLYYVIFCLLVGTLYAFYRLVHAKFGMVLRGCKMNERRMSAIGFPTLRYRLTAYVISALVCVVAGMLLANLTKFVSPSYMQWPVSGDLIVMVVLGGMGTLLGPVVGAAVWLILEEVLTSLKLGLPGGLDELFSTHWLGLMGLFVLIVTLALKQGLYGYLVGRESMSP